MSSPAQTEAPAPVIELADVVLETSSESQRTPLAGVNWRIEAGDFWVVGALPWSGKSALLATTAGLEIPPRGQVFLFGKEISHAPEDELFEARRRIGLVFEHGARLFRQLNVAQNIALPLRYHQNLSAEQALEVVAAVLTLTGLTHLANLAPAQISRIWGERVGLGRALVLRPEVLLLDNPIAGLDARQRHWWLEFLDQLAAGHEFLGGRPMTLVVTTDDLRPWVEHGRQFALIQKNSWRVVGGRAELAASNEPLLRELLAGEFAKD